MTQLALEARDIRKSYGRGQATFEALKGVSLAIEAARPSRSWARVARASPR